jgi:hypothetical protein
MPGWSVGVGLGEAKGMALEATQAGVRPLPVGRLDARAAAHLVWFVYPPAPTIPSELTGSPYLDGDGPGRG